jgi:hypothetical protein
MPDMKADGDFPRWVRFAVRKGTRRNYALIHASLLGGLGIICALTSLIDVVFPTRTSEWGHLLLFFQLVCAFVLLVCALWTWLAVRWVDRKGMWVKSR